MSKHYLKKSVKGKEEVNIGYTALMYASQEDHEDVVTILKYAEKIPARTSVAHRGKLTPNATASPRTPVDTRPCRRHPCPHSPTSDSVHNRRSRASTATRRTRTRERATCLSPKGGEKKTKLTSDVATRKVREQVVLDGLLCHGGDHAVLKEVLHQRVALVRVPVGRHHRIEHGC